MERFHSLNAARVCAEFCVVHYHLSFVGGGGLLSSDELSANLMSFFFVLSGFVTMHSQRDVDLAPFAAKAAFVRRRLSKVYPTYLIWYLLDLPGSLMHGWTTTAGRCPLTFGLALASQPLLLLQPWLGCRPIANEASWYLATLCWLWLLFALLNPRSWLETRPWAKLFALYLVSQALWATLGPVFHASHLRAVPLLRLPEFLMGGCVAFTVDRPLPWARWGMALGGLVLVVYTIVHFFHAVVDPEHEAEACALWPVRRSRARYYYGDTLFLSKFALLWCLVVHGLVAGELAGDRPWECLGWLNAFSLQTYLSHHTVAKGLHALSKLVGLAPCWSMSTLVLACYYVAYRYSLFEPRLLLAMWRRFDADASSDYEPAVLRLMTQAPSSTS